MTSKRLFLAGVIAGLSWGVTLAEPFTQGNVVVSRVGGPDDEIDVIPDSAARVRLLEISVLDGSTVQEIRLPALASEVAGTNNRRLTLNTDFRAGMLKRSANGLFLTIGGYDADAKNGAIPGTFQVNRTPATEVNRVVARIDFLGSVDTTTAISTTAGQDPPGVYDSGANASFRCVVTDDGTNFWLAGRQGNSSSRKGRVQYVPYGGTESIQVPLAASNNFDNCRVVDIYNGQLYGTWNIDSPSNNLFRGVYSIGEGLPKEVGQPTLIVPNLYVDTPADSPYDFFFVDADTAYLTSDNVPADNGGVQKFVRDTDPESPTFGLLTYRYTLKEGLYPNQQARPAASAATRS
jgi:hypothetical protein